MASLVLRPYKAARIAIARGFLVLEGEKRIRLLSSDYVPSNDDRSWNDVAAHEIVGPGYTPGGQTVIATFDEEDDSLKIPGPVEWAGSSLTAKWAVAETVSDSRLLGYADLAPSGGSVSTRTDTFRLTFEGNTLLRLK